MWKERGEEKATGHDYWKWNENCWDVSGRPRVRGELRSKGGPECRFRSEGEKDIFFYDNYLNKNINVILLYYILFNVGVTKFNCT